VNRLKLTTAVPGNGGVRSVSVGIPPRNTASPSPLSRSNTTRPVGVPFPRSYLARPSSTTPTASHMAGGGGGGGGGLIVGSAPTSNTMQSAMRFNASPLKPRPVSPWSSFPSGDEKPHERWIPTSDNESVSSEPQFFALPSAERALSNSASHPSWMRPFQLPPVTI
jgi:hypothetical protein